MLEKQILQIKPSQKFVEAYKGLAQKYPEETKNYQITSFIEVAKAWSEYEK